MTVTAKMIDARPAPPEVVGGWTSGRLTGTFMMAIWLLVGVGIILFLTSEWILKRSTIMRQDISPVCRSHSPWSAFRLCLVPWSRYR